jgi:ribosomal protein S6E (S10)
MNPVCKESFKNVLPPLPELIELPYLMNEQKKTEQDQEKIKNVTKRLEQNYEGYIIDKVFIIKNDTKKYAYTIKHGNSKEGMIIPWEFSTDVRDNSKSTQEYIIVDNVTTVF